MRKQKKNNVAFLLFPFIIVAVILSATAAFIIKTDTYRNLSTEEQAGFLKAEEELKEYAKLNGRKLSEWPDELILLLSRNPETRDFVYYYPDREEFLKSSDISAELASDEVPLFLQWDMRWGYKKYGSSVAGVTGCGPICLSMAAVHLLKDPKYSPDKIIDFALENGYCSKGSGSEWSLISEGGEKLGLSVTELPLSESKIKTALKNGHPVILIMGPGDFTSTGHFIVLTGVKDGKFTVNDPNSIENSGKLWSYETIAGQIKNLWEISAD